MSNDPTPQLPGSAGEHTLQERMGTARRAAAFYNKQMLDHLNPLMREYMARQEMAFIATADQHGECDCSFRAGPPGFIHSLDERTVIFPELRGNGVMASMGNIGENPHVGILFVDFTESAIGLHVNGKARVVDDHAVRAFGPLFERYDPTLFDLPEGKPADQWIVVHVEEAYIHCSKHIPLLARLDKDIHWATDDNVRKGGDFFKAKHSPRPWTETPPVPEPAIARFHSALAEVAATATVAEEPVAAPDAPALICDTPGEPPAETSTTEPQDIPDWASSFATMDGIDWARIAEIARRIGEADPVDEAAAA